jgi:hypothetical protein
MTKIDNGFLINPKGYSKSSFRDALATWIAILSKIYH